MPAGGPSVLVMDDGALMNDDIIDDFCGLAKGEPSIDGSVLATDRARFGVSMAGMSYALSHAAQFREMAPANLVS